MKDVVLEVLASGSRGVGITGGDPLLAIEDVVEVVKNLKEVLVRVFTYICIPQEETLGRAPR